MATSKSKSILIVDDDPDLRVFFRKLLENMGHEVFEATNTTDAANLVEKVVPHLILLDINLDEEKGFVLLEKLKQLDPYQRIKVIMVSASTAKRDIANSKAYGVHGYLVKPVTNNQLVTLMKKLQTQLNFPNYIIPEGKENLHVKAKCFGQMSKVNELSFKFVSKIKFNLPHKLECSSSFFVKHNIKHAQFTIFFPSVSITPGLYETRVQFIGLSDKDMVAIRKVKTKKA